MCGGIMCTRRRRSARGESSFLSSIYIYACVDEKAVLTKASIYSLDYLFQLAVEMHQLGLPWISDIAQIAPQRS